MNAFVQIKQITPPPPPPPQYNPGSNHRGITIVIYIPVTTSYRYRGKSPITDPLLIPTPSRILVNIRVINKLYIHTLLTI